MEPNTTNNTITKNSHGALIGSIIIVVILIIGGMYVFKMTKSNYAAQQDRQALQQMQEQDAVVQSLETQGASDDLDSIDADLKATDINSIDSTTTVQ